MSWRLWPSPLSSPFSHPFCVSPKDIKMYDFQPSLPQHTQTHAHNCYNLTLSKSFSGGSTCTPSQLVKRHWLPQGMYLKAPDSISWISESKKPVEETKWEGRKQWSLSSLLLSSSFLSARVWGLIWSSQAPVPQTFPFSISNNNNNNDVYFLNIFYNYYYNS